jgi:hypothetical protein
VSRSPNNTRRANSPGSCLGSLLQNGLVLFITLVLIAVFLEVGLRFFAPQIVEPLSGLFAPDEAAGYRLRSNASVSYRSSEASVTFHTEGTAGMRVVPEPAGGTPDSTMLVLGDSFTFGMNVQDDQAFPARLQERLNAAGPEWRVLNAGVFGYGTDNQAAWLSEHGWQHNPRLVVVGFFVGNDVKDVMFGITKTVATEDGRLVAAEASREAMDRGEEGQDVERSSGLKGWLEGNSHAYLFLRSLWYNTLGKGRSGPTKLTIFDAASFYRKDVPPEIEAGWQKTFDVLKAMQADCDAHGAELVLVVIPTREQVYPKSWDDVKAQFDLDEAEFDLELPQRKLSDFASGEGILYIDLLPDFKAANSDPNLYFQVDRHWTVKGHELAAEVIGRELGEMGLDK